MSPPVGAIFKLAPCGSSLSAKRSLVDDRRGAVLDRPRSRPVVLGERNSRFRGKSGGAQLRHELRLGEEALRLTGKLREHERLTRHGPSFRRKRVP